MHFKKEKAEVLQSLSIRYLLRAQTSMFYSLSFILWRALEKGVRYKTSSETLPQTFKGTTFLPLLCHFPAPLQ